MIAFMNDPEASVMGVAVALPAATGML